MLRFTLKSTTAWIKDTINKLFDIAIREIKENRVRTLLTAPISFVSSFGPVKRGSVVAVGKEGIERDAFDFTFVVPKGGIRPINAKAIRIVKPSGEEKIKARTYTKFPAGTLIERKGFFDTALREVFKDNATVERLADGVAFEVLFLVVDELVAKFRAQGVNVRIGFGGI